MPLPITAFYAGLLAIWIIFLLFQVVGFRRGEGVSLGAGGSEHGERLIRGHGNATETIPIFLIMLGLAEGLGTTGWLLHILALAFITGRVLHGVHFLKARKGIELRFYGMIITLLATGVLALRLIFSVVF
ncbi:MAG: MAPEG family protein [Pseudomonadota bacterium]